MKPFVKKHKIAYTPTGYYDNVPVAFDARLVGKETMFPGQVINLGAEKTLISFDYHQFEYIVKGCGYIESDGQKSPVCAGDFFFLRKSYQRAICSDIENPIEKFFLTAKGPFLEGTVDAYLPDTPFVICKCDMSENFEKMMNLCENGETATAQLYNSLAGEFLNMIQKVSDTLSDKETAQNKVSADTIMRYLDENISTDFSLDDLAKTFYLSPTNIVKIFKAKYNTTPMSFVRKRRIVLAKYYLRKTDLPVAQIAELVPLGNTKYFSNLFKKYTGMSPREYRNRK